MLTGGSLCLCADGFTGSDCSVDVNECSANPCGNGGSCIDGVNEYQCACLPPWTGKTCAQGIACILFAFRFIALCMKLYYMVLPTQQVLSIDMDMLMVQNSIFAIIVRGFFKILLVPCVNFV